MAASRSLHINKPAFNQTLDLTWSKRHLAQKRRHFIGRDTKITHLRLTDTDIYRAQGSQFSCMVDNRFIFAVVFYGEELNFRTMQHEVNQRRLIVSSWTIKQLFNTGEQYLQFFLRMHTDVNDTASLLLCGVRHNRFQLQLQGATLLRRPLFI